MAATMAAAPRIRATMNRPRMARSVAAEHSAKGLQGRDTAVTPPTHAARLLAWTVGEAGDDDDDARHDDVGRRWARGSLPRADRPAGPRQRRGARARRRGRGE